ncbi:MAG: phosphomannomutase/phosphoglucomutase, partial [Lachnospiraceae bacterium]|nr:phosphomannomutase/phosphoglucomutase [Lachnospiraceae bacterium]
LTPDVVRAITNAFLVWLADKVMKNYSELTVSVGRDSRSSGPAISAAVKETLSASGATVLDCGLASTPSMFMTTVDLDCDGAIQITASHHPFNRNGLKFFTRDGGLESEDISVLLQYAQDGTAPTELSNGEIKSVDYMTDYAERWKDIIKREVNAENYDKPLSGFKIVVDAGNGAGGFYADKVLAELGADTQGSRYLEPDGMFPNHVPNPENADAMASICEAVLESKADLGVIFDTDVDRGGAVDSSGNEINRNRLVAVASAIALEGNDGGTIVTDSITSSGLKDFIENTLGGKHHRFKRGYKNVINEALRLNNEGINCPLAIETSGHAAMRENYFLDDGAYLCTKIIIKMAKLKQEGKTLEEYVAQLKEPKEAIEVRYKIKEKDFRTYGEAVIDKLNEYALSQDGWTLADDSREGVRVSLDKEHGNGWFLLRLSVHDPIMPLNVESDDICGAEIILNQVKKFIEMCEGLTI